MRTPSGLTLEEIAQSTCRAFSHAAGVVHSQDDWDMTEPGWMRACLWLADTWAASQDSDEQLRASELTRLFLGAFALGLETVAVPLDEQSPANQVAWEAAMRHALGAITCEPTEVGSMLDAERSWGDWSSRRLASFTGG